MKLFAAGLVTLAIAGLVPTPRPAAARDADPLGPTRALLLAGRFSAAESTARVLLQDAGRADAAYDSAAVIEVLLEAMYRSSHTGSLQSCDLAQRAVAQRTGVGGRMLPGGAISIGWLAETLAENGQAAAADSATHRALAESERAGTAEAAEGAIVHDLAGRAWLCAARHADARAEFEHALAIRQRVLAPNDARIADTWYAVGLASEHLNDRAATERAMHSLLAMTEHGLPPDHPDVVRALLALARVRHQAQDYPQAIAFSESALAIQKRSANADRHLLGYIYLQAAWDVGELGDDASTLEMDEGAWRAFASMDGPHASLTLAALSTLAQDCVFSGDCARGVALAESCVAGQRLVHGEAWPDLWRGWDTLGLARLCAGDASGALEANSAALEAIRIAHLEATPGGRIVRRRRGSILEALGRWNEAGAIYRDELAFALAHGGPGSREASYSRDHLSIWYLRAGDPDSARAMLVQMTAEMDSVRGPKSRDAGRARSNLAEAIAASGDTSRALPLALEAESIGREGFRVVARAFGEHQALAEASVRARGLDLAVAFACARAAGDSTRRQVWDALVRSRALVFDEMAARRRGRAVPADSAGRELVAAREDLARLLGRGPGSDRSEFNAKVLEATTRADRAERFAAISSPLVRSDRARAEIGLREVESALAPSEGLLAYTRYSVFHGHRKATAFAAFARGANGRIAIAPLGPAGRIEELVTAWRTELARALPADRATRLAAERRCRDAGVRLRRAVWDPIEPRLAGLRRVVLVPDGALSLIPFEALPTGTSRYLVESGPTIVRIGAERDLVQPSDSLAGRGLLAMGGMNYDIEPAHRENTALAANATDRGLPPCREFGEVRFEPLAGSGDEAADVARLFAESAMSAESHDLLTAREATEAAFRSMAPGRRAIHLATHGFFVDPMCSAPSAPATRGTGGLVPSTGDLPVQAAMDPLRLSGLAFASANERAVAADGTNDGLLTAGEVAALDLEGTQIVTLSACESGLGIPVSGEGVLGLERAFHAAGARAVIMSLWSVNDLAARAWMSDFYQALWHDGRDAAEASRQASRAALLRLRKSGGATHPGEWAMFISSGLTR